MVDSTEFGPYELRGLLGRGGMGEVWEAYDHEQHRVVALKLLPRALIDDPGFVERFRRESFAAARLSDPHVIPIHRYGDIDGRLYLDMRLVRGRDLGQVIADDGPLAPVRAVSFIAQAAEALDAAHTDNLVHRDVKPSNLLVTAHDFVYLVDFGIAHVFGMRTNGQALTATGATIGTLDYMAPERFLGRSEIDARADVYSLACVLYECLTGRRPYPAVGLPALMHAHLTDPPPVVSGWRPDVSPAFDQVIAIGMAKDPGHRYRTAGDLARAAAAAVPGGGAIGGGVTLPGVGVAHPPGDHRSVPAAPTQLTAVGAAARPVARPTLMPPSGPPPDAAGSSGRRSRWITVAAAAAVVVVVAAGVLVWRPFGDDDAGRATPADAAAPSSATGEPTTPTASTGEAPPTTAASPATVTSTLVTSVPAPTVVVTTVVSQTVTALVNPPPNAAPPRPAGDLGLSTPIANVPCTGQYLTLVHSASTPGAYAGEVASILAAYPGTAYLRTDESCRSLAPDLNGNPIYAVYLGPFATGRQACAARPTADSYVKVMATGVGPDESQYEC